MNLEAVRVVLFVEGPRVAPENRETLRGWALSTTGVSEGLTMTQESLSARWDTLLHEQAALEQERHEGLVTTGKASTALEDRLRVVSEEMAALDEVFQGQEHPNANPEFDALFEDEHPNANREFEILFKESEAQNDLPKLRAGLDRFGTKPVLFSADIVKKRNLKQEIARAEFEIMRERFEYWQAVDPDRADEHRQAMKAIAAKHPGLDLVVDDPEPVAVEDVGPVAVEPVDITDLDGITLEEVSRYPREKIPVLLKGQHKAKSQVRTWNRALDALKLSLEGLKQEAIYHRLDADGQSKGGDAARQAREWIETGRRIVKNSRDN